jgi:hypothetical protein
MVNQTPVEDTSMELINNAMNYFNALKWHKLPSELSSDPNNDIIWGNVDSHGFGTHVIINRKYSLFKIQTTFRSGNEKLESACVVNYHGDAKLACYRFDHYMDATGAFVKAGWLNG